MDSDAVHLEHGPYARRIAAPARASAGTEDRSRTPGGCSRSRDSRGAQGQAARQLVEHAKAKSWTDTGPIFTREDGEALHPEVMSRYFRQAVEKAALPTIRLHDLRHTHATLALRTGIHPKVVCERLGHATVSITLDTHSHAIPAIQEEAAALIAGLLFASD